MHILHVSPYYAPAYSFGGVVSMLEGLVQAQVAQGHQVTVLTSDAFSLNEPYHGQLKTIRDGMTVIRCRNWVYPLRRYNLDTPFSMRSVADNIMPDIDLVHLHEFRTVENLLVAPIAHKHKKPIVLSPHGTLTYTTGRSTLKSFWDLWLSPQITPYIQQVIALADSEKIDIQQTWQQFKSEIETHVIPNGVNLAQYQNLPDDKDFRQKYKLDNAKIILFMGRLHQRKGVDVLAQAFHQANLHNTKLLLVGPDEGMQANIEALHDDNIIFTGFLAGNDRLKALASADVFVLPAIGEGLSMAVLEAMASGIPVLLSEGCNLPEAITAGAGQMIPIDATNIANTLQTVLSDTEQLNQMGQNAQQLIAEQFTWDKIASQMTTLYKNLSKP